MTDNLMPAARRRAMVGSSIGRNSTAEKFVRRLLRREGLRFRSQVQTLPGRPDFECRDFKVAVFVHGCFWHGHKNCSRASLPATNHEFWARKIRLNARRDAANARRLRAMGWRVITIWTCRLKNGNAVAARLRRLQLHV